MPTAYTPQILLDCTALLPELCGRMSAFTGWDRDVTRVRRAAAT